MINISTVNGIPEIEMKISTGSIPYYVAKIELLPEKLVENISIQGESYYTEIGKMFLAEIESNLELKRKMSNVVEN